MSRTEDVRGADRGLESVVSASEESSPALVPSDLRLANLARMIHELRAAETLSRTELSRRTGMAVPTVHRLISDLEETGLVAVEESGVVEGRLGRPPVTYRFRQDVAVVAGIDVGNQTTRVAVADLGGSVVAACTTATADSRTGLVRSLDRAVRGLLREVRVPLAGVGIGVAAVVHPDTGRLYNPPQHPAWAGLPLAEEVAARFSCGVSVEQDDHLAALAEASLAGTAPAANPLLALQIGKGIGVGLALCGGKVTGHLGRFGRIARWPVTHPVRRHLPGTTLGECLPAEGLVAQYRSRGGDGDIRDGAALLEAARRGDGVARTVAAWAAREIAALVNRLDALLAPEAIVFGGGLARSFDVLEPQIRAELPASVDLRASVLGDDAVVAGAILAGSSFVEAWLLQRLQRA